MATDGNVIVDKDADRETDQVDHKIILEEATPINASPSADHANPDEDPIPLSRRIQRTANSRRLVRKKTREKSSAEESSTTMADETPSSSSSDVTRPISRTGSDISEDSDEEGINDSVTNMGVLGASVYNFLGQAATSTWGWMKTAVNQGFSMWYGDPTPPEEWHCDTASEESDEESDNENKDKEKGADLPDSMTPKVRDKTFHICNELMTTEESYVRKLSILCMVKERAMKIVQPDAAKTMFQNVETIHKFHNDNLLPELKDRIANWDSNPRIGDVMKKLVPWLKLYTEYVKNFEKASQLVDATEQKNSSFAALLKEVKKSEEYGRLRVQAHMLEPIQRVPRYELLLRDYLKRLPENSTDRPDTERAMQLVSETASHFEDMMKRDTRIIELMKIQNELDGPVNVVGAKREFIKRGKILTVSAKSGKTSDKYAFLFSDMMLVCNEQSIPGLSSGHYKVRHIFELESAQVTSGNNLALQDTFYIKSPKNAVEMATKSPAERDEWVAAIETQITNCTKGRLLRHGTKRNKSKATRVSTVGSEAPVFVRMNDVSMCMLCATNFGPLKTKKHCSGCGSVVCGKCSSKQMRLDYDPTRPRRVCDQCFVSATDGVASSKRASKVKTLGSCVEQAHLSLSHDAGKTWKPTYLAIYDAKMLYSFKAPQDIIPLTSVSLVGSKSSIVSFTVRQVATTVLQIKVDGKVYHLHSDTDTELVERWHKALTEMEASSRDSMGSADCISLDSFSLDSQSITSQSSLDTSDTTSITSADSGVHTGETG